MGQIQAYAPSGVQVVLAGNKADLESERKISTEDGIQMAKKHNIPFFECSAKTGVNVQELFQKIGGNIHEKILKGKAETLETQGAHVIKASKQDKEKKKCC